MKNLFFSLILTILTLGTPVKSAEVGDIYYHDKTFSNKVDPDKVPIGVVFWVSPDNNFGLIVSLEQNPNPLSKYDARAYCSNYSTLGTKPGDWELARIDDLLKLGNSFSTETNTLTDNLTKINKILKNISIANEIRTTNYIGDGGGGSNSYYVNLYTGIVSSVSGTTSKFEVRCITGF